MIGRRSRRSSVATGKPFVPFDIEADYHCYVDGKPRLDGIGAFLKARGIGVPLGISEDAPGSEGMHALGNLKKYFLQELEQQGVEAYGTSITLVRALRELEIKTAAVSSSKNCGAVLRAAAITELFDARVDGMDLARLKLRGKPVPDKFLETARRVGVEPARALVVENATAGVEAGRGRRIRARHRC